MKTFLVFAITQASFEQVHSEFSRLAPTNFYTTEGDKARFIFDGDKEDVPLPQQRLIVEEDDESVWYAGYLIQPDAALYTSGDFTTHGVIREGNQFYLIYSGNMELLPKLLKLIDKEEEEPKIWDKDPSAPGDLLWFETLTDYYIRKGEVEAVKALSKEFGGIPTPEQLKQHLWTSKVYRHYKALNPGIDLIIAEQVIAPLPETMQCGEDEDELDMPGDEVLESRLGPITKLVRDREEHGEVLIPKILTQNLFRNVMPYTGRV